MIIPSFREQGQEQGASPTGHHRRHRPRVNPLRDHQADDYNVLYQTEEREPKERREEAW